AVEGEQPGIERREADAARRTEQALRGEAIGAIALDDDPAVSPPERPGELIPQLPPACRDRRPPPEGDVGLAGAAGAAHAGHRGGLAVDAGLRQPQLAGAGEDLLVIPLAPADHRREQGHPPTAEITAHAVEDLPTRLGADRLLALRAVLHPDLGE